MRSFARWWLEPTARAWVAALFVLIVVTMAFLNADHGRIDRGERNLSRAMCDIHALLTVPPTPGQPPVPPRVRALVVDLNGHLAGYCPRRPH